MYNYILSRINILDKPYKLINIDKARNYFYICVSYYLYGIIEYHSEIRKIISNVCKDKLEELCDFQEKVEIKIDKFLRTKDYIYMISKEGNWATNIDISLTAYIYNINIAKYLKNEDDRDL